MSDKNAANQPAEKIVYPESSCFNCTHFLSIFPVVTFGVCFKDQFLRDFTNICENFKVRPKKINLLEEIKWDK